MKITPQQINHRLAVLWYANTYGEGALNGIIVEPQQNNFIIPDEYKPPYPNPSYWPKSYNQDSMRQVLSPVQSLERITPDIQQKSNEQSTLNESDIDFPSWFQFWNGNIPTFPPSFPPPVNPMLLSPDNFINPSIWATGSSVVTINYALGSKGSYLEKNHLRDRMRDFDDALLTTNYPFIDTTELPKDDDSSKKDIERKKRELEEQKKRRELEEQRKRELEDRKKSESEKNLNKKLKDNFPKNKEKIEHIDYESTVIDRNPYDPPIEGYEGFPNNMFEELCCIGFNPEDYTLEAIIAVKQRSGYGGELCSRGSFVSVGFFLIEPSETELNYPANQWISTFPPGSDPNIPLYGRFIGESSVRVYDIDRNIHSSQSPWHLPYQVGYLHYSVRIKLNEEDKKFVQNCNNPMKRLPRMQCVLQWNRRVNGWNFNNYNVYWGDMKQADIQYPVLKRNLISDIPEFPTLEVTRTINRYNVKGIAKNNNSNVYPIHASHLPNGNILLMGGSQFDPENKSLDDSCAILNPLLITQRSLDTLGFFIEEVPHPGFDIFCAGHSTLPDGNLFVAGGTEKYNSDAFHNKEGHDFSGLVHTSVFDWQKNIWLRCPDMLHGRWYPSTVVLSDGNVLVMDGHREDGEHGHNNDPFHKRHFNSDLEIFSSQSYRWQTQKEFGLGTTAAFNKSGYYPRLFLLGDGSVFSASTIDWVKNQPEVSDKTCRWDPISERWIVVNDRALTTGHADTAIMFPINASIGDEQTIMIFGSTNPHICKPLKKGKEAEWVGVFFDYPSVRVHKFGRINCSSVLLPDGRIAFFGGVSKYNTDDKLLDQDGVRIVEIFDPYTLQWSTHESLNEVRNYHSFAILLTSGDVLIGGGNANAANGKDTGNKNFEIYTPPYPRTPKIKFGVDKAKSYFNRIPVQVYEDDIGLIRKFTLIRQYSVTHGFAYDQRLYDVFEFSQENGTVILHLSENKSLLPPGYYMLFAISLYNSVSEGKIIQIL